MKETLKCPHCSRDVQITEALTAQLRRDLGAEFEAKARARDAELKKREEDIKSKEQGVDKLVSERLNAEKLRIFEEARKRSNEERLVLERDLRDNLAQKESQLKQAHENEIELRRKTRELEDRQKMAEIELARKMDAERENIRRTAVDTFTEEHRLKDLEKDKQLDDMRRTIDDLKRKSTQGSMQTQGEVLELDMEVMLKARFPTDVVEPVAKGVKGADIIHKVYNRSGAYCGSIVWEFKRTKAWSDAWIQKLKDDQMGARAEFAVIATEAMPKDVTSFSSFDNVWVTTIPLVTPLAEVLRNSLMELARARTANTGKNEKMEAVYNYLSGPEFRHKVTAILSAFKALKEDLDSEKRALQKIWAKREKQLERVIESTAGMYGDLQGIVSLPEIKSLELGSGEEDAETPR